MSANSGLVLTKDFGGQTILASPRAFTSKLEAAEEALTIVGSGIIEAKDDTIIVHQYLKEPTIFKLTPASHFVK